MKKIILIAIIICANASLLNAQDARRNNDDRQQKIQAAYVAFVTQRLNLTPEEAQKFWPVHMKFLNELKAVRPDLPELDKQQAILNIKKKYQNDFVKILGAERTEKFFGTSAEFNKKLLERIKKRKQRNLKDEM